MHIRTPLILAPALALAAGCTGDPETGSIASAGMLNGMLNGFHHVEGLTAYLGVECPMLQERLLGAGGLAAPFPEGFEEEIARPACESFLYYTAQLMVPHGESLTLNVNGDPIAAFAGAMGLEHIVAQAYPDYSFAEHAFLPAFPIARKVATQGYAALTNQIHRRVSFRTNVPELDAHRESDEDEWPRELLQLVPFTPAALDAMQSEPGFLERLPDFFNACLPSLVNYRYLAARPSCEWSEEALGDGALIACKAQEASALLVPEGNCPLPVVVHGNLPFVDDVVPGRSCRILRDGEEVPAGSTLVDDVIVPEGGCPFIYYTGRDPSVTVYDDRAHNEPGSAEGCDIVGPSEVANCEFDVISQGLPISDDRLDYYVFNVQPIAPAP